jgi:two-component system alkaline phosphatase synthesis response regulator PhoP
LCPLEREKSDLYIGISRVRPRAIMKETILVVDDEKDIVDLLSYNLTKEGFKVITARNGRDALVRAKEKPNLMILDVMMPELSGLQVIQELQKEKSTASIPVLLLTAKGSESDEIVGLEIGADDYIKKPVKIGTLIARVHAALRKQRAQSLTPELDVLTIEDLHINVSSYTASIGQKKLAMPRKEFETLVFLVRNRGRVLSRETILNAVWGENIHVVDRTVDVHIRKIREKIGSYAEYIETVAGVGYRFKA